MAHRQELSAPFRAGDGPFMEPSRRNRWQPLANATVATTAQTGDLTAADSPRQQTTVPCTPKSPRRRALRLHADEQLLDQFEVEGEFGVAELAVASLAARAGVGAGAADDRFAGD